MHVQTHAYNGACMHACRQCWGCIFAVAWVCVWGLRSKEMKETAVLLSLIISCLSSVVFLCLFRSSLSPSAAPA